MLNKIADLDHGVLVSVVNLILSSAVVTLAGLLNKAYVQSFSQVFEGFPLGLIWDFVGTRRCLLSDLNKSSYSLVIYQMVGTN